MRYILRIVPEREHWLPEIVAQIPHLEVVRDDGARSAMDTFLRSLLHSGDDGAVHLEDDAQLTSDFTTKIETAIAEHPDHLIQFYSRHQADLEKGSRWMAGSSFTNNQCYYLPPGYAEALYDFYPTWPFRKQDPNGYDILMAHWLRDTHKRYWLHVPSLVQHRRTRSVIDRRRSSNRQSASFQP